MTSAEVFPATEFDRKRFRFFFLHGCREPAERLLHRLIVLKRLWRIVPQLLTEPVSSLSLWQLLRRLRFEQTDLAGEGFGTSALVIRLSRSWLVDRWKRLLHSSEFLITFALERGSFLTLTFPLSFWLRLLFRKVANEFLGPTLEPNVSWLPNRLIDEKIPLKLLIGSSGFARFFAVSSVGMELLTGDCSWEIRR